MSLYIIPRQVTLQLFFAPEGRLGIPPRNLALTTSIRSLDCEISLPNLMLTLQLRSFDPGGPLATHMSVCDRIIKPPSLQSPPPSGLQLITAFSSKSPYDADENRGRRGRFEMLDRLAILARWLDADILFSRSERNTSRHTCLMFRMWRHDL